MGGGRPLKNAICRASAVLLVLFTLLLAGCAQPERELKLETETYLLTAINELRTEQQCQPLTQDAVLRRKAQGLLDAFERKGAPALDYQPYINALERQRLRSASYEYSIVGTRLAEDQSLVFYLCNPLQEPQLPAQLQDRALLDQRARRIGLAVGEVQGTRYWVAVVGLET